MAEGKDMETAANEVSLNPITLKRSLQNRGKIQHSLFTKPAAMATRNRGAQMALLCRIHERMRDEFREELITKEQRDTIWQRMDEAFKACSIKVADYRARE